jgi:hypothetical protein
MKVGDLVEVVSADHECIYGVGIYRGIKTTWKEWHMVYITHPPEACSPDLEGSPFDEPYWEFKVISNNEER